MSSDHSEHEVSKFMARLAADRAGEGVRALEEYQRLFPDCPERIAEEYARATSASRTSAPTAPPRQLGSYRILRELGRGGQGYVYLAEDVRLKRKVALKILDHRGPGSAELLIRFEREATIAARLDHPHICAVHDTGTDGGVAWIAMRYVEGETLAQRIAGAAEAGSGDSSSYIIFDASQASASDLTQRIDTETTPDEAVSGGTSSSSHLETRLQLNELLLLFEKTARALHVAHEAGIVHRDVKPGNIMITRGGEPVVLDFGLARDDVSDQPTLTRSGDIFGTPAYMSPEQLVPRDRPLDRRTDVYSLAVTLYECLTLRRPFEAPTRSALYQAILDKDPANPRRLNGAIPRDLAVVVQCGLEKDGDRRYATAEAFARDLQAVREGRPVTARPVGPISRFARWSRRHPARASVVLGLPVLAVLVTYVLLKLPDIRLAERERRAERLEAQLGEAFSLLEAPRKDRSLALFEDALQSNPREPAAVAGKALALYAQDRHQEVLDWLAGFEDLFAAYPVLQRLRAEALLNTGRREEALALHDRIPDPESALACFLEGQLLVSGCGFDQDPERAREAYEMLDQAILRAPHARLLYHMQLAHAVDHLRDPAAARRVAGTLTALWPEDPRSWAWEGRALRFIDPERSEAAFLEALRRGAGPDVRAIYGVALDGWSRPDKARQQYLEALAADPGIHNARANLARSYQVEGRHEEAAAEYRCILADSPDHYYSLRHLPHSLRELGHQDEAIATLRRLVTLWPDDADDQNQLGILVYACGRFAEAEEVFRKAVELDPHRAILRLNLGNALIAQGQHAEALESYQMARELDPELPGAHDACAELLVGLERYDEALVAAREAVALSPDDPKFHETIVQVAIEAERPKLLVEAFTELIRLQPESAYYRLGLGILKYEQKRFEEAEARFREAVALAPGDATLHEHLGNALCMQERDEEAIAAYELARGLDPNLIPARYYLAAALVRRERHAEAKPVLEELLRLDPSHWEALAILEQVHRAFGSLSELVPWYEAALRHRPDVPEIHCNFAVTLRTTGDLERAVEHFRRGHQLGSTQGAAWRYPSATWLLEALVQLSRQQARDGDPDAAVATLEEARDLMGGADVGDVKLADVEAALHRYRGAR